MQRCFGKAFLRERQTEVKGWANLLDQAPMPGYLESCVPLRDADLSENVGRMAGPAACIRGFGDLSIPPSSVKDLAERLPGASYYAMEFEGAGRITSIECSVEFARTVIEFMEKKLGISQFVSARVQILLRVLGGRHVSAFEARRTDRETMFLCWPTM